jgi:uncharacterized protein YukE
MTSPSAMLGMDPVQANAFAQRMSADAAEVGSLVGQIASMVSDVGWFGAEAERFRQDWDGVLRPRLSALIEVLNGQAQALHQHATNQLAVSG